MEGLDNYDVKLQLEGLERRLKALNSRSHQRREDCIKASKFYQKELVQSLTKLQMDHKKWKEIKSNLLSKSEHLQRIIAPISKARSRTSLNLEKEKRHFMKIVLQLAPEWQRAVERKQLEAIGTYENELTNIQKRRKSAEISFEKEKRLLLKMKERQIKLKNLQMREKREAKEREKQRQIIIEVLPFFTPPFAN